jgi:hypothetical protein
MEFDDGTEETMNANLTELDHRQNDGIAVSLLWDRATNQLTVAVSDGPTEESFLLPAAASEALEVFRHPFAYLHRARSSFGLDLAPASI